MDLFDIVISGKINKGGGEATLIDKDISANGTYNASSDSADGYKKVVVAVPNSYAAGDEGKVVSNGALVSQTSVTKSANGTYDTTTNNEVVVAVPSPSGNIDITSTAQTNVSAYATAQVVDADLVAGNIKKDVDILGVVGTYEGGGGGIPADYLDGSIKEILVPEGLTSVRAYFMQECLAVEKIDLPSTLTSISDYNFYGGGTVGMTLICRAVTPPTISGSNGMRLSSRASWGELYVPAGSVDAYKASTYWKNAFGLGANIYPISE